MVFSRNFLSLPQEIAKLADDFEAWGRSMRLEPRAINCANLILDELLTNIVKYGYKNQVPGNIELHITFIGKNIEIIVRDQGSPFNLLDVQEPDVSKDLDSRTTGGLGIYFVRQLADNVFYRRDGDVNEVVLHISMQQPLD